MIIDKEWDLAGHQNPLQGSFVLDQLADLVEEAVLAEFDRISERGGILGAMETGYQRGKIQDESMLYEHRKHDGSLPLVGVNTFTDPTRTAPRPAKVELARASEAESRASSTGWPISARHAETTPAALRRLEAAAGEQNVFAGPDGGSEALLARPDQEAFFEVGGQYRRNV
jgi:isobutyryl-CoA mutase